MLSGVPNMAKDGLTGAALKEVSARFGEVTPGAWRRLLSTGPGSAYWPSSLPKQDRHLHLSEFYQRLGAWHASGPWQEGGPCQNLLYLAAAPLSEVPWTREGLGPVVRATLEGLFAALGAVGATSGARPPETVRMTILGGGQFERKSAQERSKARALHMALLAEHACELLTRSPVVQRLDICFFDKGERRWVEFNESWNSLMARREAGEPAVDDTEEVCAPPRARCVRAVQGYQRSRIVSDPLVLEALTGLEERLLRALRPSSRDLGFHFRPVRPLPK